MATVSLRQVRKAFGAVEVVHGVDLEIADGEFVVLVGPSGCGKSTILRMVAGLEDVTAGEIAIDGVVVNERDPKDRDIAMVFQNYALYPHMSVAENMAFSLRYRGVSRTEIRRRVEEAAAILDIAHLLDRRPRELSGGQRQRVAMGRAIVRDPKVFLFDEPLSNLDAKLRAQTRLPDGSSDFFTLRRLANGTLSRRSTVATAQSSVGNITLFRIDYLTRTRSSDGTPRFSIVENLRNDPDRNLTDRRVDGVCSAVVTVTASRPGSWGVSYQCTLRSVVKIRNQSYTLAPPSA